MKISIIIPVYNVEPYLGRCIDSVLNQSHQDIEIILINDGSVDNSGKICDEYAIKDKRIKVTHKPNSGVSAARNDGIRMATGDYISFIDSDDYIEPNMLKSLLSLCIKTHSQIAICAVKTRYIDGKVIRESYNLETEVPITNIVDRPTDFSKICGSACQCLYSLNLIQSQGGYFEEGVPLGEDRLFNMKIISSAKSIVYTNEPFYNYLHHKTSAVRSFRADYFDKICKFRIRQLEYMNTLNLNNEKYSRIFHIMFLDFVVNCINNAFSKNNSKENIKEVIKRILDSSLVKNSVNSGVFKEVGTSIKIFILCHKIKSKFFMLSIFKTLNKINYKKIFQELKKVNNTKRVLNKKI
ncbi:glycosyltransferase family 2 protein [Priestia megaterium]|uniref:glycosyltransferase family 2 protein n=1 Tax=Priestia megaterium TaxID=1404 RepID=UPI000BFE9904|nr:glycosyltransferase family 2 protein [Priestia megaterium]PGT76795.1 hypothetical protein COD15_02970 [Priestia megaterium]